MELRFLFFIFTVAQFSVYAQQQPNIIFIYADDVGYGDVSCYGAGVIATPNIDRIASEGVRFTNAYASSATCTPSRYSLLTGKYAWRQKGTGIARGNAAMIINPKQATIASVLKRSGYRTGVVGKWHLGLGPKGGPDWNEEITPGPHEIGFDYSFLIPSTGDRVPCVYVENQRIVDLDPADPIQVSYGKPIGDEPTGKAHPELLKMKFSHGHDQTIINGISRIGYMDGAESARWVDEDMADVITAKAKDFIKENKDEPFFLYFSTHDIHVPRVPHSRFEGKSGMGPRGDAMLQLDWSTGEILEILDSLNLAENTLIVFSSDNGPVLDDGYEDYAVEKLNGHTPAGPFRGGKYSSFEAGTRIPFIVRWPEQVTSGESQALVSQVDLMASLAELTGQKLKNGEGPDSQGMVEVFLGKSHNGRGHLVQHARNLSIIKDGWKYIEPGKGPKVNKNVLIELGMDSEPQLYDLNMDFGEVSNVAAEYPEVVKEMSALLESVKME